MANDTELLSMIDQQRVMPLFYHDDADFCINVLKTLHRAGIRSAEFTNRGPRALANFQKMMEMKNKELKGFYLGIGTIKNVDDADRFLDAEADFFISPGYTHDLADWAISENQFWIPGCMTPSEIIQAEVQGFSTIKIFPGSLVGQGFIKAIRPLFPDLRFMITGGVSVDQENIDSWFAAGAGCVGVGSKLFTKDIMEKRDLHTLEKIATGLLRLTRK